MSLQYSLHHNVFRKCFHVPLKALTLFRAKQKLPQEREKLFCEFEEVLSNFFSFLSNFSNMTLQNERQNTLMETQLLFIAYFLCLLMNFFLKLKESVVWQHLTCDFKSSIVFPTYLQ